MNEQRKPEVPSLREEAENERRKPEVPSVTSLLGVNYNATKHD